MSLIGEDQDLRAFRELRGAVSSPTSASGKEFPTRTLVAAVAIGVLLLTVVLWRRRRRQERPFDWTMRELAAFESAFDSCEATAPQSLDQGYAVLSQLLRVFLERQLGFPATAQSTQELQQSLADRNLPASTITKVTRFFTEADEVKFSGRAASGSPQVETLTSRVREIVAEVAEPSQLPSATQPQGE